VASRLLDKADRESTVDVMIAADLVNAISLGDTMLLF
jgi:hypothetical protein